MAFPFELSRRADPHNRLVFGLGLTQMLGWGSSYYLPATLAAPMGRELDLATGTVYAAFSWALVVCALTGPLAGRAVDRWGGRPVMSAASLAWPLAWRCCRRCRALPVCCWLGR